MNLTALRTFCRVIGRAQIPAADITIKGKETMTISFTGYRTDYSQILEMCKDSEWAFHASHDAFLDKGLTRYQIHLDGRLPERVARRTDAQLRADNYEPRRSA